MKSILFACGLSIALVSGIASASPDTASVATAFERSRDALFKTQKPDGSFTNLVETSSAFYANEMILLYEFLGILESKRETAEGLMRWTWRQQNADGGISGYPNGPSEVGISVQTYLAARILGESESSARMRNLAAYFRPRRDALDEFLVRPFLMVFGLDRTGDCVPGFLPRIGLRLEGKLPWFKRVLFPMLHILSSGHVHRLPPEKTPIAIQDTGFCPDFLARTRKRPGSEAFWKWIEGAFNSDGTLFEYAPTTIPGLMALSTYEKDDARGKRFADWISKGVAQLERFQFRDPDGSIRQAPGDAAVGETSAFLIGMHFSGISPSEPAMEQARKFLLHAQHPETGAFGMSTNNEKNPDSDDTALAIGALRSLAEAEGTYGLPENAELRAKLRKGMDWMLGLQNRDGGFATWEKDHLRISKPFSRLSDLVMSESVLEHTARAAATLALFRDERPEYAKAYARALKYIRSNQLRDGSYPGTWFVNYLFGTAIAITALATHTEADYLRPDLQKSIEASLRYIADHQHSDGGFSESPASFEVRRYVPLPSSSPSQTGIVTAALLAFAKYERYRHWNVIEPIVDRAVAYLVKTQKEDGFWHDSTWTGVVFPRFEYAIYPTVQELGAAQALGMYLRAQVDRREHDTDVALSAKALLPRN
jgi:squalene cyclase